MIKISFGQTLSGQNPTKFQEWFKDRNEMDFWEDCLRHSLALFEITSVAIWTTCGRFLLNRGFH